MIFTTRFPFGYVRSLLVLFFALTAGFALYLDYFYVEPQWLILDDPVGRFLAFALIHLGPEIAVVGIGTVILEFILRHKLHHQ